METALLFATCAGPFLVFLIGIPLLSKLPKGSVVKFLLSAGMIFVVWQGMLTILFYRQRLHEITWRRENAGRPLTEDSLVALGDYPNVFAGWLLFAWIPVVIGWMLAKRVTKPRRW